MFIEGDNMKKTFLKFNSWYLTIIGIPVMLVGIFTAIYCAINAYLIPSEGWINLGGFILMLAGIGFFILGLLPTLAGISTLYYLKKNKAKVFSIIANLIEIILFVSSLVIFVFIDSNNIFSDYYTGHAYMTPRIIITVIAFIFFINPSIINILSSLKNAKYIYISLIIIVLAIISINIGKIAIINKNKIKITNNNVQSYTEFEKELKDRHIMFENRDNEVSPSGSKDVLALDSKSKYSYELVDSNGDGNYRLNKNTKRKFPLLIYTHYSLFNGNDDIYNDYYFNDETRYVKWYVYYVNDEIYAASEYVGPQDTSVSKRDYEVVLSENKKITIYNSQYNYYVKGGCIVDTRSGVQRNEFPTTNDINSFKCRKIKVVDRVDEGSLDSAARDIFMKNMKKK